MTLERPTAESKPLVSFAIPVRNGADTIAAAIDSIRAQTIDDWELVISDNLSTDDTSDICAAYAAEDERIRHIPTGRDLSQHENFSEAFQHSRGVFFRWHGDDDWLEPTYAERTVEALQEVPEAVLCTTLQLYYDGETPRPLNQRANFLSSVDARNSVERLIQFLRLLEKANWMGIDPIYSLSRRDAVATTGLLPPYRFGDFIYACEMALAGRFTHVPDVLAHRRIAKPMPHAATLRALTNRTSLTRFAQREVALLEVWKAAGRFGGRPRIRLVGPLIGFAYREHAHGTRRRVHRVIRGAADSSRTAP